VHETARLGVAGLAILLAAGTTSACSSSGSASAPTTSGSSVALSATQYRAALHNINVTETKAQHAIQQAFGSPNTRTIAKAMSRFAADQKRIAMTIGRLHPPADAIAANHDLATAFAQNAAATRTLVPKIAASRNAAAAQQFLMNAKAPQRSGHQIDAALGILKGLGYTTGS